MSDKRLAKREARRLRQHPRIHIGIGGLEHIGEEILKIDRSRLSKAQKEIRLNTLDRKYGIVSSECNLDSAFAEIEQESEARR